jgi:hypothetical protein
MLSKRRPNIDSGSLVLPYYDAANRALPFMNSVTRAGHGAEHGPSGRRRPPDFVSDVRCPPHALRRRALLSLCKDNLFIAVCQFAEYSTSHHFAAMQRFVVSARRDSGTRRSRSIFRGGPYNRDVR